MKTMPKLSVVKIAVIGKITMVATLPKNVGGGKMKHPMNMTFAVTEKGKNNG